MRKSGFGSVIVIICIFIATHSLAAEFYDSLFSLIIPNGWKIERNVKEKTLTLRPNAEDEATAIIIFPPNPGISNRHKEIIGTYAASFSIAAGHGDNFDVLDRGKDTVAGFHAESQAFAIPKRYANLVGTGFAVDVGGFVTLMFAITTPELYDTFMPQAKEVMDSYTVDADVLNEKKEELATVAEYASGSLDEKVVFDALRLNTQDRLKSRPIPWHTIKAFFK